MDVINLLSNSFLSKKFILFFFINSLFVLNLFANFFPTQEIEFINLSPFLLQAC